MPAFFTKTYSRLVRPALAELNRALPEAVARHTLLGGLWRDLESALEACIADAAITA
jgi:hypothetical protein